MAYLEVKSVAKRFGSLQVLHDMNIGIERGDFLVLVGPSGCGKSTLLGIIAGLEELSSGQIMIDGMVVNDLEPKARDIAMVFQSYALYPSMTVARNIGFSLEMARVPKAARREKVCEVAKLLKIDHLLNRRPSQLSGGQRQRVAMGRALVRKPKIFLFDEPLSNLDAKLRVEMRVEIKKLHQRLGSTIVYVTHDQIEAMTMATKIAVLRDGRLQQFGTPAEIYGRPANTFVATFMGSPPMNLLPARVIIRSGSFWAALDDGSGEALPLGAVVGSTELAADQMVYLGIRPESVQFAEQQEATEGQWTFSRKVIVVEPTGPNTLAVLGFGEEEFVAALPGDSKIIPGAEYAFAADLRKAVLFDRSSGEMLTGGGSGVVALTPAPSSMPLLAGERA